MIPVTGGVVVAVALYLAAPGHPSAGFAGVPLDALSLAVLALVAVTAWIMGRRVLERRVATRLAAVALLLIAAKISVGVSVPAEGWRAEYFANDTFAPPARRSTEFRGFDGTRIDRALAFKDDTFPVHFFNENTFNRGIRREVTEPFSVRWTGFVDSAQPGTLTLRVSARGRARVAIDGSPVLELSSGRELQTSSTQVAFESGSRNIEVTYVKPADTDGLLAVTIDDGTGERVWGAPEVTLQPIARTRTLRSVLWFAAVTVHVAAVGWLVWTFVMLRARARATTRSSVSDRVVYAALAVLLIAQGFWKALPFYGRFLALSGGDDWFQYEAFAREILNGGLLITFGRPLGQGEPFFYYPLYSYFLALVHLVTGETLFGVVIAQFVALLFATILVHRLARRLFGAEAALVALGLLIAVEQIAFVRHYTAQLLAENLFFLTTTAAIYLTTRYVQTGRIAALVAGGLMCGVSAITRPSIMLMLPPAVFLIALVQRRRGSPWLISVGYATVFASAWAAVLSLTLLRNYVVSGQLVLITTGTEWSFVLHNLPYGHLIHEYMQRWANIEGSRYIATARVLFDLLWNYPVEFMSGVFTKVLFSLGMVHSMGGKVHPELLMLSSGYLVSLMCFPAARQLAAWPAHLFVLTHLVMMTLTMPGIYGYRMILPMYLFFAPFAGLLAWTLWSRLMPGWSHWPLAESMSTATPGDASVTAFRGPRGKDR